MSVYSSVLCVGIFFFILIEDDERYLKRWDIWGGC